ncbi:MAG: hypothetical protein UZ17_ACD001001813 [Acidobacteria bacterium OLB17]|nr:MAG: hypothetical protein UZ17_ACD001001813 [Acidobacteria bacterium OLB17]
MKRIKLILIGLAVIIILSQVPFAYRRYVLGQAAGQIAADDASRRHVEDAKFDEYRGVIHAHTAIGGHSLATFDELISGANAAGLNFVVTTEHWSDDYDTSALTLSGMHRDTLFVAGNEIDTADGDRMLMVPGSADAAGLRRLSTRDVVKKLHDEGRLALVTYPERFHSWRADIDGDEVFNLHTAAKNVNRLTALFDLIWSGSSYPELVFARSFTRPDENLAKFDSYVAEDKATLFAGTDAHSNIGFYLLGDEAGHRFFGVKLDPYERMFRIMRVHVLIPKGTPLSQESLLAAISDGRVFVGLDTLGDTSGFRFRFGDRTMGERASAAEPGQLTVDLPLKSRVIVFKNGQKMAEASGSDHYEFKPEGPGVLPRRSVPRRPWCGL